MKISKETMTVFKNFAEINGSLVVRKGKNQKTVALAKNILASVALKDEFPVEFGIYDLVEFLNVLNSMPDPEVEFEDEFMTITSGRMSTRFIFSDKCNIHPEVPEKGIDEIMPKPDLSFTLRKDDLDKIRKIASVLSLDDVVIAPVDGNLVLRITDLSSENCHKSDIVICEYTGNHEFSFNYKISRFTLMPDDYDVHICAKLISHFVGKNNNAEYLISLEKSSSFV